MLADGTGVAIYWDGYILVDIDGPQKGPAHAGIDIFQFTYDPDHGTDEITPAGMTYFSDGGYNSFDLASPCYKTGDLACTAWVVMNGNMDYLKVDNSGNCPNGTKLSTTNITCK